MVLVEEQVSASIGEENMTKNQQFVELFFVLIIFFLTKSHEVCFLTNNISNS